MARTLQRLTALSVSGASSPGYLADGGGLYLQISKTKARRAKSWIFRFALAGRRREMGLALQLSFLKISESMGNHDSKIVGADSVD